MLTLLNLAAVLTLQSPPAPPPPPPPPHMRTETHVMIMGDDDGPGGLDRDGDGQISREEFAGPMNDAFVRMDTDGNGRLSPEELRAGHGPGGPGGPGGEREMLFRRGPAGAEGGPGGEHEIFVRRMGPGSGPMPGHDADGDVRIEIQRLGDGAGGNDLDTDGDGRISEAEFLAPMRAAFARMDTDHSGSIEAAEKGGEREIRVITRHREGPGGN